MRGGEKPPGLLSLRPLVPPPRGVVGTRWIPGRESELPPGREGTSGGPCTCEDVLHGVRRRRGVSRFARGQPRGCGSAPRGELDHSGGGPAP
eukprot:6277512-Heterocapsa_arctica.AAC.1